MSLSNSCINVIIQERRHNGKNSNNTWLPPSLSPEDEMVLHKRLSFTENIFGPSVQGLWSQESTGAILLMNGVDGYESKYPGK